MFTARLGLIHAPTIPVPRPFCEGVVAALLHGRRVHGMCMRECMCTCARVRGEQGLIQKLTRERDEATAREAAAVEAGANKLALAMA